MGKTLPEKRLQRDLQFSIDNAFPGNHYIRVTHPDEYEQQGIPDLVGHICGLHFECELKVDSNRPSPSQLTQLRRVNESGGLGCIILHHRKDEKYYLIIPPYIQSFSYRERANWIVLPHGMFLTPTEGQRVHINLLTLRLLIFEKIRQLIHKVNQ
jgi:penicillin-binding protein-related factor A (putative recombinase)